MDIGKISAKNLMQSKLQTLLDAIEEEVKAKNFAELDKCVAELAKIGENLVIKENADGTRVATVKAKDGDVIEDIDFMAVLQQLKEKFDEGKKKSTTYGPERVARENFIKNVEKTIGTLLKENEITQELVARGVSDREIIDNGENEIKRSSAKVEKLKPLLQSHQEIKELLGVDSYIETAKKWDSKSKVKQIEHANIAKQKLEEIKKKLEDMENYAKGLGTLDSEGKTANKAEIDKILSEVKELKKEISDLQINGLDLSELNHINEYNDAEIHTKIDEVDNMITSSNNIKDAAMSEMRTIINSNPDKFSSYTPSGVAPMALTEEQLKEITDKIDKDIKMYATEIKYEETYQADRREFVDRFKEFSEKVRNLGAKFQPRTATEMRSVPKYIIDSAVERVTNPDGTTTETEKRDADGNILKAIYELDPVSKRHVLKTEFSEYLEGDELDDAIIDEIGENWRAETVEVEVESGRTEMVATPAARQEALRASGIANENAYIDNAKQEARREEETAIATLSASDKRRMIRDAYRAEGGFHPILFLRSQFAPNAMWENGYKSAHLTQRVTEAERNAETTARAELESIVTSALAPELEEYQKAVGIIKVTKDSANNEFAKADSRNSVLYHVKKGTDEKDIKESAIRAAIVIGQKATDIYVKRISGEISNEEFSRLIEELNKEKESIQKRAYTDDLRNPQQYDSGYKEHFKDDDGEER